MKSVAPFEMFLAGGGVFAGYYRLWVSDGHFGATKRGRLA